MINVAARAVEALPISYAFGAGMLATVNPCGFVMLPSFAAFYLTAGTEGGGTTGRRLGRALLMGLLVSLAFVATFGVAGLLLAAGGRVIVEWVGWAGLAIGLALMGLGAYQLAARRSLLAGFTSGARVRRRASVGGVLAFGVAYAVASLSCTLPVFMVVVASVFVTAGSYVESALRFVQYGLGMGLVLTAITLGVAAARAETVRAVGTILPYVESAGNVLLIFAGAYLVWYWTALGGLL
ncbi:MAG: cytochrome c biogenesis CcdA family protein [Candidatus Limnocylindria bacterium]